MQERKIWAIAITASLLLHALFLLFVSLNRHEEPKRIAVRLVDMSDRKSYNLSASGRELPAQKAEKKPAKAEKKMIAKAVPVQKSLKAEQLKQTPVETSKISETEIAENTEVGSSSAETGLSGTCNGAGNGSGHGTGHGTGEIVDVNSLVILKKVVPEYPGFSRRRSEEGTVTLLISVVNGSVTSCIIEKTSGYPRLDEAAKRAIKQWKFSSVQPLKARVPINFKITN